jgi:hypothetical protein
VARFGIDFVSTRCGDEWRHYAIEINLRKGGTTHPYLTLQLLTDGGYDPATGLYRSASGRPCFYVASDNLSDSAYAVLTPDRVIAAATRAGLAFDHETESGVVFHLMGALADHGKLGAVCIARTPEGARALFDATVRLLQRESARHTPERRPATSRARGQRSARAGLGRSRRIGGRRQRHESR